MQDSSIVASRQLECMPYFFLSEETIGSTHSESMQKAKSWGFHRKQDGAYKITIQEDTQKKKRERKKSGLMDKNQTREFSLSLSPSLSLSLSHNEKDSPC